MSDVEKASRELVTISYSLRCIKTAKFKQREGCILIQGKTNLQKEPGETGQKSQQVQNSKRMGPPVTIKLRDRHGPEPKRNWTVRSGEEKLKHSSPASYTHKRSSAFFSGQTQGQELRPAQPLATAAF